MRTLLTALLALGCAALLPAQAQDAPKKPEQAKPAPNRSIDRNDFLKKYDKNGDGKLDEKEREVARKERQAEFLKKYDKNADGKLDDTERKAAREEFQKSREGTNQPPANAKPPGAVKKAVEEKKEPK